MKRTLGKHSQIVERRKKARVNSQNVVANSDKKIKTIHEPVPEQVPERMPEPEPELKQVPKLNDRFIVTGLKDVDPDDMLNVTLPDGGIMTYQ